jgi:hypothetical protein
LPNEYERIFKEELWGCFKYIGIPMDTLMNMPIADRKFYIMLHNKTEGQNLNEGNTPEMTSEEVDKYNMMQHVKDWH